MSVIGEIATWSSEQSDWISDAVRRLFVQAKLEDEDIVDLAALLKTTQGFEDPMGRVAVRFDAKLLREEAADTAAVSIMAISRPKI